MVRVLLIEDNDAVREEFALILQFEGHEVVTAENGRAGIARLAEARPDIVVCDLMMPEVDGYEVLRNIRENAETATLPFLFLTARAENLDMRVAMALGANDYLIKPVGADDLLRAVALCPTAPASAPTSPRG